MYTFISLIGIRLSYTMHDAQVKQTPIKDQIWTYITLFNIQHSSETVILHRCGYFKHWKIASQFLSSHNIRADYLHSRVYTSPLFTCR